MNLSGRVVVITGASRGIGRATAVQFGAAGATVVVVARTATEPGPLPGTLAETVEAVEQAGGRASAVACNLASQESIEALIETVVERHGSIDVLINNAAFTGAATMKPTPEITRKEWELQFAVNVHAPFMLIRGFTDHFSPEGGVILNVTSEAAELRSPSEPRGRIGATRSPSYGATKAALNRVGNHLAGELVDRNIAVITVDPGSGVLTETMKAAIGTLGGRDLSDTIAVEVPAAAMRRLVELEDPMLYSGEIVHAPTWTGQPAPG